MSTEIKTEIKQEKAINSADAIKIAKEKNWNPVSVLLSKAIYYIEPGIITPYQWEVLIFSGNPKNLSEFHFIGKKSKPMPKDEE